MRSISQRLYDNFWVAYDALDLQKRTNSHLLKHGIELARNMQQAIVRMGTGLVDKNEVKQSNDFYYIFIENTILKDNELFQYPLAIQKLASFILPLYKVRKTRHRQSSVRVPKDMPLVIGVKN